MSRAIRLLDLRVRLQAAAETSVSVLADTLGVSERTVRRDLAALRDSGMPITGEPGPGGGIRLEGARGLAAVHLAVDEVASLWLATRLAHALGPLSGPVPWGHRAERVLPKLLAALPKDRASALRGLCGRIFVGPPASDNVRSSAGSGVPELLTIVEAATYHEHAIQFVYHDRNAKRTSRCIEPHGVLVQLPLWYLLARDAVTGAHRMFRMDRVSRPALMRGRAFVADVRVARSLLPPEIRCTALL
jgi:predicted DNA-binding transcriptional regulator YafY